MVDIELLLMSAVSALNSHFGSSNSCSARVGNDTRNDNQLANQIALEISEHFRELISVNLHLEQGHSLSILGLILVEIVGPVDLLDGFLKLKKLCPHFLPGGENR